jgi:hypothetical protein
MLVTEGSVQGNRRLLETAELGDSHDCAGSKNGAEGSLMGKDAGQCLENRVVNHGLRSLCNAHLDGVDLCAALLFGRGWVDAGKNDASLVRPSASNQLP